MHLERSIVIRGLIRVHPCAAVPEARDVSGAGGASVLLVSANRERSPQPVLPNGLACVASSLAAAGHRVELLDLLFERDPEGAARRAAERLRPDVVGIGVRNIDNSDAIALRHYTPEAAGVLRALRAAAPGAPVLAGGAAFGVAPEALFRELEVDYAVAGDGERASAALVEALAAGRAPVSIPGLVRRVGERVVFTPRGDAPAPAALPTADPPRGADVPRHRRALRPGPPQAVRGLGLQGVDGARRNVEGWGYRLRAPEAVADE